MYLYISQEAQVKKVYSCATWLLICVKACGHFYILSCTYIRSKNRRISSFQHFLYFLICLSFTSCFSKKVLLLHIPVTDWVSTWMGDCQLLTKLLINWQTDRQTDIMTDWLTDYDNYSDNNVITFCIKKKGSYLFPAAVESLLYTSPCNLIVLCCSHSSLLQIFLLKWNAKN